MRIELLQPKAVAWTPPRSLDRSDRNWPTNRMRSLAYVVGVLLKGDGSAYTTRKTDYLGGTLNVYKAYKIELLNKSIGFTRAFNRACSIA